MSLNETEKETQRLVLGALITPSNPAEFQRCSETEETFWIQKRIVHPGKVPEWRTPSKRRASLTLPWRNPETQPVSLAASDSPPPSTSPPPPPAPQSPPGCSNNLWGHLDQEGPRKGEVQNGLARWPASVRPRPSEKQGPTQSP